MLGNLHRLVKNIIIIDKNMKQKANLEELVVKLVINKIIHHVCINIGTQLLVHMYVILHGVHSYDQDNI